MKQTIRRRHGSSAACCIVLSNSSIQKHAFANIARIFDLQNSANFNTIPLFLCTFLPDWYATFQAFGIFGFVGINLAMFLVVLAMFVDSCKGNAEVKMAATILCFVAGKLLGGQIESAMGVGGWGVGGSCVDGAVLFACMDRSSLLCFRLNFVFLLLSLFTVIDSI